MARERALGREVTAPADLQARLDEVLAALRGGRTFLITTHQSPDADGIGSGLGLAGLLRGLGKEVTVYIADPMPPQIAFLSGADQVVAELADDARFDVSIVTDCADLGRLGPHLPDATRRGTLIYLDHHLTEGSGADIYFNDPTAAAVGEIVLRIARALGAELTTVVAECLYVSLHSDTGSFRYANTSPSATRAAAELLEAGVDPWKVSSALYESQPVARLRLLSAVLATLDVSPDGRCATLRVSQDMIDATGARWEMVDGFVNYARSVRGVEVAVLTSQREDGRHRISFRSRGEVNVAAIAARFGGGGHFHAAGCTVEGDYATVREEVYSAVREAMG